MWLGAPGRGAGWAARGAHKESSDCEALGRGGRKLGHWPLMAGVLGTLSEPSQGTPSSQPASPVPLPREESEAQRGEPHQSWRRWSQDPQGAEPRAATPASRVPAGLGVPPPPSQVPLHLDPEQPSGY